MTKAPTLAVLNKTGSSTLNAVDATVSTEETETLDNLVSQVVFF